MQAMQTNVHVATEGTNNILSTGTERVYKAGSMIRVLVYLFGVVIVVAAFFVYLFFRPDIGARVFFGVDSSPVEISLKHTYDVPVADKKTLAIVAAARLFLDSLDDSQRQVAAYRFTDNVIGDRLTC